MTCKTCGGTREITAYETIHGKPRRVINDCPDCAPTHIEAEAIRLLRKIAKPDSITGERLAIEEAKRFLHGIDSAPTSGVQSTDGGQQ
jgi:hypothetical protein